MARDLEVSISTMLGTRSQVFETFNPTNEFVAMETRIVERRLRRMNFGYRRLEKEERMKLGLLTAIEEDIIADRVPSSLEERGEIFLIESLPKPGRGGPPLSKAFTHPAMTEMHDYLRNVLGYELYIDSSLEIVGCAGNVNEEARAALLSLNAKLTDAAHELGHVVFLVLELDKIPLGHLPKRVCGIKNAAQKIKRFKELWSLGYPVDAIDERMAADDEIAVLMNSEKSHLSYITSIHEYANSHLVEELTRVARERPLNARESLTYTEALKKHVRGSETSRLVSPRCRQLISLYAAPQLTQERFREKAG